MHNRSTAQGDAARSTLDHRMSLYSLAATAAGVSALALAPSANAEVVVTKANLPIIKDYPVNLDFNHDGITDFQFSLASYADFSFQAGVFVQGLTGGEVVGRRPGPFAYASALVRGAKIGPSAHFTSGALNGGVTLERSCCETSSRNLGGYWGGNQKNRYVGVEFPIDGETHYGWVRVTLITYPHRDRTMTAEITAYAYETIAGESIVAGLAETGSMGTSAGNAVDREAVPSLGVLALGAEGLSLWRREELA